jgi:hypothetical protein
VSDTESPKGQTSPLLHRAVLLVLFITACLVAYGLILARFNMAKAPDEAEFGASPGHAQIRLYLQPTHIDPVNHSIQVRINLLPGSAAPDATTIADRNYVVRIRRGEQIEQISAKAGQPLPEATFEFSLENGNVRDYPFDRYVSSTVLSASAVAADGSVQPLPIRVTAWEGLFGFTVEAAERPAPTPGALALEFVFSRTSAVAFFSLAIYGAMFVVAICALAIGSLIFVGLRKIEVPFVGALGAMIFALPVLRNALPGTPPLGVRADGLIFFWAELGAIVALCLFILAWARGGAKP